MPFHIKPKTETKALKAHPHYTLHTLHTHISHTTYTHTHTTHTHNCVFISTVLLVTSLKHTHTPWAKCMFSSESSSTMYAQRTPIFFKDLNIHNGPTMDLAWLTPHLKWGGLACTSSRYTSPQRRACE